MKQPVKFLLSGSAAAVMLWSFAAVSPRSHYHQQDPFAAVAFMSNCAEIAAGKLAMQKAQDPKVSQLGKMMVADHTAANEQLIAIVGSAPSADSLDAEHEALSDSLMAASGAAFDALYIKSQVRDHHKAIALFQEEAKNGQEQRLKTYAQKLLPKLKMHLQHVMQLSGKK